MGHEHTYQKLLEMYRLEMAKEGHDLRKHHWQWHHTNQAPRFDSPVVIPSWGADNPWGTLFLEMHRTMLYGAHHGSMSSMKHGSMAMPMPEGIFTWLKRKG